MNKWLLYISLLSLLAINASAGEKYAFAPSPVIGYDPDLGVVLGGALFVYPDQYIKNNTANQYFDIQGYMIEEPAGQVAVNYKVWGLMPNIELSISSQYSDFYSNYYGIGDSTNDTALAKIEKKSFDIKPGISYILKNKDSLSFYIDHKSRTKVDVVRQLDYAQQLDYAEQLGDEATTALQFSWKRDTRNARFSPDGGALYEASFKFVSPQLSNLNTFDDTVQLELDYRNYIKVVKNLVWASRASLGLSSNKPSHLFMYSIGGSNLLRGYSVNRFVGRNYYAIQNELRFPIWKTISGTAFVEFGDVSETGFDKVLVSKGVGLRFALPPDYDIKLRLDIAQGGDEDSKMFFNFDHAF